MWRDKTVSVVMIGLIVVHRLRSALGIHAALPGAPQRAKSPRA